MPTRSLSILLEEAKALKKLIDADLQDIKHCLCVTIAYDVTHYENILRATKRLYCLLLRDNPAIAFNPLNRVDRFAQFFRFMDKPDSLLSKYFSKITELVTASNESQSNQVLLTQVELHVKQQDDYCREIVAILPVALNNVNYFKASCRDMLFGEQRGTLERLHRNLMHRVAEIAETEITIERLKISLLPFSIKELSEPHI